MQDIFITPQPSSGEPSILFTASGDVSPITLNVVSGISPVSGVSAVGSGITSLSFEGTQGQLFSITDNLSSGTLFSVSDIAGLPFMEIDASGDIKLAQFGNTVTTYKPIQFSNTVTPTHKEGMLFYDNDNKALAYYNEESDVTLQIGQEQFLRSRNTTGATITNGSIVIITGSHGNVAPTISGAIATSENSSQVIGVATHNIEDSSFGYVTTYGIVRDVDTSAFSDGDEIFLSSTSVGSGTPIVPALPNYKVSIGHVIRSHATAGSMLVQVKSPKLAGGDTKSEYPVYVSGIPFVTASGNGGNAAVLGYDSDFNWDSGNSRLGIGTATPEAKLDITGNTSSDNAPITALSITGKTGSGTNWSGTDVEAGYTHTDGSADPLVTNITPSTNTIYVITYTISGFSAGRFDFIDFGGVRNNVYSGSNGTYTITLRTINSTDPLELTPRSDFAGTVSIDSVKTLGSRDAVVSIRRSDGTLANEIRTGVSETQPYNSIYIGYEAGQSVSGIAGNPANTAVGRSALKSNVNGSYNTVFGYLNSTISTENSYLTLVGHNLLSYFRSGSTNVYNTAIGTNIGYGTDFTGSINVLIGNSIFTSATSPTNNVAIGYTAMRDATNNSYNVAIGSQALQLNAGGTSNTALGALSLVSTTAGSFNVAIGRQAGRYYGAGTDLLTDSDNSIFIGYNTKASGDSQTNQVVIGHEAVGNGSNSVTLGNTSITKTILNGDVGINTISPGAKLHAVAASATDVVGLFEGAAGQSANVLEVKDSAGNTDLSVSSNGVTNLRSLEMTNAITLQSNYYVEWGGGNNRIRGISGGVGAGRIELIAGANIGTGGKEIPLVARGDGRGGKGAVIMGQNRDTDYHLEVVGSGSFEGVNISGALTIEALQDVGAGDQNFNIKYDPDFRIGGSQSPAMIISTDIDTSGDAASIHIIAGPSGTTNYNGIKVLHNQVSLFGDLIPQSNFGSDNPSFGVATNPFYKGYATEFIVGSYFSQATLVGDGQNKLGLRNGTSAQTFNLYNTYTSASNYARLEILGDGTDYVIKAANAGASSQGNTILRAGAATTIPSVIQGAASQSASLTEWQNSSSDVLTQVDATGSISTAAPTYIYTSGALGDADYNRIKIYNDGSNNFAPEIKAEKGGSAAWPWAFKISNNSSSLFLKENGGFEFIAGSTKINLTTSYCNFYIPLRPSSNSSTSLGVSTHRWSNTYTADLDVSGILYASGDPGTAGQSLYSNANGIEWRDSPVSEPVTNASGVTNMMIINSGDYAGITPDANTLYFIVDP